jgi:hypothetical protein
MRRQKEAMERMSPEKRKRMDEMLKAKGSEK